MAKGGLFKTDSLSDREEVNLKNQSGIETLKVKTQEEDVEILITDLVKSLFYKVSAWSMIGDALVLHPDKNFTVRTFLDFYVEFEQTELDPSKPEEDCSFYGKKT